MQTVLSTSLQGRVIMAMIKLTAALVTEFVQKKARAKKLNEEIVTMTEQIKKAMKSRGKDEYAPVGSQMKLVLQKYDKTAVSYKDMAQQAFKELWGKKWKVLFNRGVELYGTTPVVALKEEVNENYKHSVV